MDAAKKLTLPLDALIKHQRKSIHSRNKLSKASKTQPKRHTNVKKTVVLPVSSKTRARANLAAASLKRQTVMNKRRKGLVTVQGNQKQKNSQVSRKWSSQLHRSTQKGSRSTLTPKKPPKTHPSDSLDVSNIQRHFKTYPKKFDLPEGTNLRVTIDLKKVQPVVGTRKK
uniref:Chitobiosyldiphosphodolichol betamannosyltransferase putative n=1 Tax=Albugo laibachii Nc14 TaxID=890382 RepID=F0WWR3_9STRA|nr:chitobiosyldiphosphodolichol betamannosyltransferase putative [Albugo laibachii Nc14]|eukprot:CCA25890.1 chitobiosyldiphosphodolichol betamannosyltransferase putative [Albugo laibachii Nc14]